LGGVRAFKQKGKECTKWTTMDVGRPVENTKGGSIERPA